MLWLLDIQILCSMSHHEVGNSDDLDIPAVRGLPGHAGLMWQLDLLDHGRMHTLRVAGVQHEAVQGVAALRIPAGGSRRCRRAWLRLAQANSKGRQLCQAGL